MLTVQNLIAIDPLKLQVAAGTAGLGRTITWAHTVDLPDPWRWVSPGDLVMTTGVGLPQSPAEQVEWLEQLVQSNASALVIAPRQDAPELTQALLDAADRLLFPVLLASFQLEFVKLSHQVIESVLQAQRERFNASERLFQTYAEALRKQPEMAGRLSILGHEPDHRGRRQRAQDRRSPEYLCRRGRSCRAHIDRRPGPRHACYREQRETHLR